MALYRYEAVDSTGKEVRGAMNAADETAVAQKLATMGFVLKSITRPGATQSAVAAATKPPPASGRAYSARSPVSVAPSVKIRSLSRFYRQLAVMVRSGMPIGQSLSELEAGTHVGKLRRAARELGTCVQQGDSLSSAMARYPHLFPVHTVGMIWAGELGGYLDVALDEAATELEGEAKDGLWASIGWFVANLNIFCLILMMPMMNVGAFFQNVILNAGKAANPNGDIAAPNVGAAIQAVVQEYMKGFVRYSVPTLAAWVIGTLIWRRLKRVPEVRRALDNALLLVPNWGNLHRERARARFLKSLQQMYHAGVAPAQAWAAASMTVRNSEIANRLRVFDETLRRADGNLQSALMQSGVFSPEDANMVGSGERAGSIPEMLDRLADYHNDVAGGAKLKGRLISVNAMIIGLTLISGYFVIKITAAYFNLGVSATKGL